MQNQKSRPETAIIMALKEPASLRVKECFLITDGATRPAIIEYLASQPSKYCGTQYSYSVELVAIGPPG